MTQRKNAGNFPKGTALITGASRGIGAVYAEGVRIQALLPAVTATDIRELAGLPYQNLPPSIVMSAQDMVDPALAGLDQGELVPLPSLQDRSEWTRFEAARRALSKQFGNSAPAARYGIRVPNAA